MSKQARMIGNYVNKIAREKNISNEEICAQLNCTSLEFEKFILGLYIFNYAQFNELAHLLGVTVIDLLQGDSEYYEATIIEDKFDNSDNREKILDILTNYMDIYNEYNKIIKGEQI